MDWGLFWFPDQVETDILPQLKDFFLSVFISSALHNSLGQINVPFMTLPFNIVALVSFSSWQSDQVSPLEVELEATNSSVEVLRMMEGTILSMGQVISHYAM